jgi:hypothetical protein
MGHLQTLVCLTPCLVRADDGTHGMIALCAHRLPALCACLTFCMSHLLAPLFAKPCGAGAWHCWHWHGAPAMLSQRKRQLHDIKDGWGRAPADMGPPCALPCAGLRQAHTAQLTVRPGSLQHACMVVMLHAIISSASCTICWTRTARMRRTLTGCLCLGPVCSALALCLTQALA